MCNKVCIICNKEKDCLDYNINGRNGYRNKKCKICLSIFLKEKRNNPAKPRSKTVSILEVGNDTARICKACGVEYPINHFYFVNSNKGTRNGRCKTCYKKKIYIYKNTNNTKYKPTPQHKQTYDQIFRLTNVNKQDYVLTYKFLSQMGYDISKNISKQFCEKYNLEYKEKPKNAESQYLFDGTLNPKHKFAKNI